MAIAADTCHTAQMSLMVGRFDGSIFSGIFVSVLIPTYLCMCPVQLGGGLETGLF